MSTEINAKPTWLEMLRIIFSAKERRFSDLATSSNFTDDPAKLKLWSSVHQLSLAKAQINKGWRPSDPKVLQLEHTPGETIAKSLIRIGVWTEDIELLKLEIDNNMPIAYHQIDLGWCPEDPDLVARELKLSTGHLATMAKHGAVFKDKNFLTQVDEFGNPIAYLCGAYGKSWVTTNDKSILSLANPEGETVAHAMAQRGWLCGDVDILSLYDEDGVTVDMYCKGYRKIILHRDQGYIYPANYLLLFEHVIRGYADITTIPLSIKESLYWEKIEGLLHMHGVNIFKYTWLDGPAKIINKF